MASSRREIAAKVFEAALFNHTIRAQLCTNNKVPIESPKRHYIEIYSVKRDSEYSTPVKMKTILRFFVTIDQWQKMFIPNGGLTPGQVMKMLDEYGSSRVLGPNPWND